MLLLLCVCGLFLGGIENDLRNAVEELVIAFALGGGDGLSLCPEKFVDLLEVEGAQAEFIAEGSYYVAEGWITPKIFACGECIGVKDAALFEEP